MTDLLLHPMTQLLFNPFAGAANFNLVAVLLWALILGCTITAIYEN
jgi:hypothetical protein